MLGSFFQSAALATSALVIGGASAEVYLADLSRLATFTQMNAAGLVLESSATFNFVAEADGPDFTAAKLNNLRSGLELEVPSNPGNAELLEPYASETAMNIARPLGTYELSLSGGPMPLTLVYNSSDLIRPPTPTFDSAEFVQALQFDPGAGGPLTFTLDSFALPKAATGGSIRLLVVNQATQTGFSAFASADSGAVLNIPADWFELGQTYRALAVYEGTLEVDGEGFARGAARSIYSVSTEFEFTPIPEPNPAPIAAAVLLIAYRSAARRYRH